MVSMVGFEPTPLSGYCGFRDRCVSHFTTSKYLEIGALIPFNNRELYWRRGRDSNSQSLSARRFSRARLLPTKVPRHYVDFRVNQPHIQSLVLSVGDCICYYIRIGGARETRTPTPIARLLTVYGVRGGIRTSDPCGSVP